nr:reverse transcriptase domain, reverse transcriptase zinc-binding domain protein [Tanacetum cinerariifolium]
MLFVAKIPVLDTGKFDQWQFRIQQYLQHEHYALWEVIEFGDSYNVPTNSDPVDSRRKDGRTVTVTTDDMQKKKNDVKASTALLLSLPDEHQLRNDLDSMSLDDLYNHLKVYEAEVQKKPNSNSQNMAFISSSKHNNNEDGNTERGRIESYRQGSKAEEKSSKALMAIDGIGATW